MLCFNQALYTCNHVLKIYPFGIPGIWVLLGFPDFSLVQELKLYLVWDSEGISERTDSIVEDLFTAADDADAATDDEDGRPRKKGKKKRKRSSTGSSESDKESSSDSESSEKVGLECFQKYVETIWNAGGFAVLIGCFQGNCKLFWQCPPYVSCFNHLKEKLGIDDFLNFSVFVCIKISALAMRGRRKRKVRSVVQRRARKESHPRRRARRNVRSVWPGKRPSLRRRKHVTRRRSRRKCWTKQKRPLLWEVAVHGQWF